MMKLSSVFFYLVFLSRGLVEGQTQSQPECADWTQTQVYDTNSNLQAADDAYIAAMKTKIEETCFDSDGVAIPCSIDDASDIPEGDTYKTECHNGGGVIWTYTYSPLCGDIRNSDQTSVKEVYVCASANCESIGVSNLIPQPELKQLKGQDCASGVSDIEKDDDHKSDDSAANSAMSMSAVGSFLGAMLLMMTA